MMIGLDTSMFISSTCGPKQRSELWDALRNGDMREQTTNNVDRDMLGMDRIVVLTGPEERGVSATDSPARIVIVRESGFFQIGP